MPINMPTTLVLGYVEAYPLMGRSCLQRVPNFSKLNVAILAIADVTIQSIRGDPPKTVHVFSYYCIRYHSASSTGTLPVAVGVIVLCESEVLGIGGSVKDSTSSLTEK